MTLSGMSLFGMTLSGETENREFSSVPFKMAFHEIGWNALNSFTYNYGLNFIGAGLVTYGAIESGFDTFWRDFSYDNSNLSYLGYSLLVIGMLVPPITPILLYRSGENNQDIKAQITAMALTQSLILTLVIQSPIKMITGRGSTNIRDDIRSSDDCRKFNWFNMDFMRGWPSGHTATAFSAAATIAELYNDNTMLKAGVYSYAFLMGIGMSLSVHWASDVLAGALIGYAIGKTVGKSFNKLLDKDADKNAPSFYFLGNSAVVSFRL